MRPTCFEHLFPVALLMVVFADARIPRLARPPVYGSMLSKRQLSPRYRAVRSEIVDQHNFYRSTVNPPAENMEEMKIIQSLGHYTNHAPNKCLLPTSVQPRVSLVTGLLLQRWYPWAAKTAQKWANKCLMLAHASLEGLNDPVMGQCGQNIFVVSTQVPWSFAIRVWDIEKHNFSYGGIRNNSIGLNGHYTQLVWASSNKVGCGYSPCQMKFQNTTRVFHNYVCNYCPIGNHPLTRDYPYKSGAPCASCPSSCRGGRLCSATGH
ncbi:cysteine-rich venom protein LEI1-like [Varroa destructor]|uniref:SCP domain-containing protein n=1 Tax=Varroa destructor TaxID=109461 RepID=A0A7M7MIE6_VARDE|nr:cysteine-rich venom protein LEI1-like [Varroa destructor]